MTTIAPIDLERDNLECVALIDLENIRLSWQRTYSRVFEYADLVLLCQLTERLMESQMTRIVIFATDPKQYHGQQIKALAMREKILTAPAHAQLSESDIQILTTALRQRGISIPADVEAGYRLIHQIKHDVDMSVAPKGTNSVSPISSTNPQLRNQQSNVSSRKRPRQEILTSDGVQCASECRTLSVDHPIYSVGDNAVNASNDSSSWVVQNSGSSFSDNSLEELSDISSTSGEDESSSDVEVIESKSTSEDGSDDVELLRIRPFQPPAKTFKGTEAGRPYKESCIKVSLLPLSTGNNFNNISFKTTNGMNCANQTKVKTLSEVGVDQCQFCSSSGSDGSGQRSLGGGPSGICKVELRLYGFKSQKGRVVQRGCDVALGAEITKACFHPNVDKICLFSADSDFQELMQENLQAEDIGGVLKYAKTSWVCGFKQAFTSDRISGLQLHRRRSHRGGGDAPDAIISNGNIRYVLLDEVFPQIRILLAKKHMERLPWFPLVANHGGPAHFQSQQYKSNKCHGGAKTESSSVSNKGKRSRASASSLSASFTKKSSSVLYNNQQRMIPPLMPQPKLPSIASP